jgi:AcrR family transcriptional regulator
LAHNNSGHYYRCLVKTTIVSDVGTSTRAVRRPPGEARRLLLDAARELFARKDYRSTTTREIAESAGVTEYLLFRHFGSKAGLFREALVLPFTRIVDDFATTWQTIDHDATVEEDLARHFVEQVYDVVVEHRGLLLTLVASEAFSEEEIAEAGISDIRRALGVLGRISGEGMQLRGMPSDQLPAHSTMAMIVGMVALRSSFFGTAAPSRDDIVDELVQATLHGFLHRDN